MRKLHRCKACLASTGAIERTSLNRFYVLFYPGVRRWYRKLFKSRKTFSIKSIIDIHQHILILPRSMTE